MADNLCTVAPNVCWSSELKLAHDKIQALRILRLLLDFLVGENLCTYVLESEKRH